MRFGIIGVGAIGATNVPALMAMQDVEIIAIANRTVAKAENLCEKLGLQCAVYSDWREMLSAEKPEAVLIQLYNDMHFETFVECARKGIHILIEKPLANRYEDCLKMIEVAKENGVRASVLQTQRYGHVLQTAKKYITENKEKLGELVCVSDRLSCNYFHDTRPSWHLDPVRSGGGIVLNYGVHQLDRVHWLMEQKTDRFYAQYLTKKPGINTCSSYTMMGVSEQGTPYSIQCNGYTIPGDNEILLTFVNGIVHCQVMDSLGGKQGVYAGNAETGYMELVPPCCIDGVGNHETYCRQMREALDYLTGKTDEAPISLEWAAEMVRLCCMGFEA